jgi:hypothetical protein
VDQLNPESNTEPVEDDLGWQWVARLNYEGCDDIDVVENERYRVIFRRYPQSENGRGGGRTRLLFVDKDSWFESEEILAESHHGDSVAITFVDESTISVDLHRNDRYWRQESRLGDVDQRTYHLDQELGVKYY